jgi:hypothetical protein
MSILLTAVYRFNIIPVKMPITFLQKRKTILKFMQDHMKKKSVGIPRPDIKLYRKLYFKNRHTGQWDKPENPNQAHALEVT